MSPITPPAAAPKTAGEMLRTLIALLVGLLDAGACAF